MKKMLTAVPLLLIAAMVFATGIFAAPVLPFDDIGDCSWAAEAINSLRSKGIMIGVAENKFAPSSEVLGREMLMSLYRVAGCPKSELSLDALVWSDKGSWDYPAVVWGIQNGIIQYGVLGFTQNLGHFRFPNSIKNTYDVPAEVWLRRCDVIISLYYMAEYLSKSTECASDLTGYNDFNDIINYQPKGWYVNSIKFCDCRYDNEKEVEILLTVYMGWAVAAGIIKGYDDNTLRPNEYVTRAEYAVMLDRFLEYVGK